ncbi:MAG TPA: UDP-N-acetylglucosamine 2-epimerase (non-hydrolyzing) [Ktedonobacteraceae bacterium]
MRFASVVGARPQFIKAAAVSSVLRQQHKELLIHTGQHYDYALSAQFFEELSIPEPDYSLACGSGTHGAQTGRMLETIEQVLLKERVDQMITYGDTNSTLAAAMVAAKLHIPIAHVEAGLRSFNRAMPEEINRVITDHLSEYLFCPTEYARHNLRREGIVRGVEVVGDVMYDMLLQVMPKLDEHEKPLLDRLHITAHNYVLMTVHRAGNTDDPVAMQAIAQAVNSLEMPVIFPVHPRTRVCLQHYGIDWQKHVQLIEPLGYLDMLALERAAHRILTDSGGIQKEAFLLGVPCVTMREETEWMETVEAGWNTLTGTHRRQIVESLALPAPQATDWKPYGRGDAAQRIVSSWQE